MKNNKAIILAGLVTFGTTISSVPAFAEMPTHSPSPVTVKFDAASADHGKIVKMFRTTDHGLKELSPEEMQQVLKDKALNGKRGNESQVSSTSTQGIVQPNIVSYGYKFHEDGYTSAVALWGQVRRISSVVQNATTSPATRTISYSTTDTYSCNLSLNSGMKNALTVTLGGSWSSAYTYSDSSTVTIQPGQYEWACQRRI